MLCQRLRKSRAVKMWIQQQMFLLLMVFGVLLKNQLIDGALLVRINNNDPLKAEPFIARTKEEILSATGSKYVPVSLNQLLNQILSEDGRFAVDGLPCHMQGIRRAELKNRYLRDKIIYHFGLTCSHTLNYNGIHFLLHKIGISRNEIIKLEYRGHGWPSGIRVSLKNGQQKFLPNQNSLWSEIFGGYFFTPYYCTLCDDHLNEMSDISFADAWLSEVIRNDKVGTSVVVTRTQKGEELIKESVSNKWIEVSTLTADDVIRSQLWPLFFKKRNIKARIKLLKAFGRKLPKNLKEDMDAFIKPTSLDYIAAPIPYINIFISKNTLLKYVLGRIPLKILAFYRRKFKKLLLHNAGEIKTKMELKV